MTLLQESLSQMSPAMTRELRASKRAAKASKRREQVEQKRREREENARLAKEEAERQGVLAQELEEERRKREEERRWVGREEVGGKRGGGWEERRKREEERRWVGGEEVPRSFRIILKVDWGNTTDGLSRRPHTGCLYISFKLSPVHPFTLSNTVLLPFLVIFSLRFILHGGVCKG